MRMNKNNYKQYDTRWAKLGYPKSPYFIKNCGCGEVSICNCIIEIDKYAKQTPKTIQPYCKQFAAPNGNGTYFTGIPTMMKHYGMTSVKEHQTMDSLWAEMAKGGRVAVLLMGNRPGGSKKVHWTSSAHFVAAVKYKKKDGKHYLYIKDSNSTSTSRNGWLEYTSNLRGDVSRVWSGKLPVVKTWVDKANAWAKKIAADDSWHYVVWKANDKKTQECPICNKHGKGKYHGWNCIGFSFAYWHHGGGLKCNCSDGVLDNALLTKLLTMNEAAALKKLRNNIGLKDIALIRNNGKVIPQSKMKAGDLCIIYDGNGNALHIYPYIGNGKMIDCGHWSDTAKQIAQRNASPCKVIIRYTGK